jgi:hypothetical protein
LNEVTSNVDVSSNDDYPHLCVHLEKKRMVSIQGILQYKKSCGVYCQS